MEHVTILLIISNMEFLTALIAISSIISALSTGLGLFFINKQFRLTANSTNASFILELEDKFNEHYSETYSKFLKNEDWFKFDPSKLDLEAVVEIEIYLAFFATLELLRNSKFISIEEIDKMFAYRFFTVASNKNVVALINSKKVYWEDLLGLIEDWIDERKGTSPVHKEKENDFRNLLD